MAEQVRQSMRSARSAHGDTSRGPNATCHSAHQFLNRSEVDHIFR